MELRYLNLSGNKRLEIKPNFGAPNFDRTQRDLSDFRALTKIKVLGLMDLTIRVSLPEENEERRIRTTASEHGSIKYGMAQMLGRHEQLCQRDIMVQRSNAKIGEVDEYFFGLFDGKVQAQKLTKYLVEHLNFNFATEAKKTSDIKHALKRAFLRTNKEFASVVGTSYKPGSSAVIGHISGTSLYCANVGDARAVLCRSGIAEEISEVHKVDLTELDSSIRSANPKAPERRSIDEQSAAERRRIQRAEGFITHQLLVKRRAEPHAAIRMLPSESDHQCRSVCRGGAIRWRVGRVLDLGKWRYLGLHESADGCRHCSIRAS